MFCKFCGVKIGDDSKFCNFCGKDLRVNTVVQEQITNPIKSEATTGVKGRRKISDLTVNDFPGVDGELLEKWKKVAVKTKWNLIIASCIWMGIIFLVGNIIPYYERNSSGYLVQSLASIIFSAMVIPSILLVLLFFSRKSAMMMRKMGINYKKLNQVLKNDGSIS